jgi:hypothetical protein
VACRASKRRCGRSPKGARCAVTLERTWAIASAHADGVSLRKIAAAAGSARPRVPRDCPRRRRRQSRRCAGGSCARCTAGPHRRIPRGADVPAVNPDEGKDQQRSRSVVGCGSVKGGKARAELMTADERRESARRFRAARWADHQPKQLVLPTKKSGRLCSMASEDAFHPPSPAARVIDRFGGQSQLARLLGKGPSTVQYWATTGRIPPKWHARLLELAAENGVSLAPSELVAVPDAPQPPETRVARWAGVLPIGDNELPCYVLDDGRRVISRTGATKALMGVPGRSGDLESYIRVSSLQGYLPEDFTANMIEFTLEGVTTKTVRGITAESFCDLCTAYVRALENGALQSDRQREIAAHAGIFLAAAAKVGLLALIDEATGYQYDRAEDALRFKLKVFLEDEMRKWEKTFPDQLWTEFGRLTNWKGAVNSQRPKYWGKLVMELVYDYLDPDVAQWLRENAPQPRGGQNYHQWLSGQYGLKRLTEHLWMLIGMAAACQTMPELRQKMAERFGRQQVQFTLFINPPAMQRRARPQLTSGKGEIGQFEGQQAIALHAQEDE